MRNKYRILKIREKKARNQNYEVKERGIEKEKRDGGRGRRKEELFQDFDLCS